MAGKASKMNERLNFKSVEELVRCCKWRVRYGY